MFSKTSYIHQIGAMPQSEQVSSVLSSPSSSRTETMSARVPSSPTSLTSSTSHEPLQADSMGATVPDPTTRKIAVAFASEQSPKRAHQQVEEKGDNPEHPRKHRASSNSESMVKATLSVEQAILSKTETSTRKARGQAPVGNVSRSSRVRKPPKKFWVVDEKEQISAKKAVQTKKPASKVFDPVFITSNSTSRLGKADIYHMLLEDLAWTSLTRDQQNVLLSMLPPSLANPEVLKEDMAGNEEISRPQAFTMSNDCFRTDVAKFKEDLINGHLAKTWQAAAEQAVIERAAGKYDEWKAEEAEAWWGQKSK